MNPKRGSLIDLFISKFVKYVIDTNKMTFFSLIANKQSGLVDNASVLKSIARKWSRVRIYLHPFFWNFFLNNWLRLKCCI